MSDLGRRAVAAQGWRWMPGMLAVWKEEGVSASARVYSEADPAWRERWTAAGGRSDRVGRRALGYGSGELVEILDDATPALTDPATLGCLLALVRERWARPIHVAHNPDLSNDARWEVVDRTDPFRAGTPERPIVLGRGTTEAEAMVAALLAAP